jgi:hypothetical protein
LKNYLLIDSSAIPSETGGVSANDPILVAENIASIQYVAPIDTEWIVVTWNFEATPAQSKPPGEEDLTRYIITVERVDGLCFTPIVKFQVPVSHTPLNDCGGRSHASKLKGASQPFRVKLCGGDKLLVGLTKAIGANCTAGQCGASPTPGVYQQDWVADVSAIIKLFIF